MSTPTATPAQHAHPLHDVAIDQALKAYPPTATPRTDARLILCNHGEFRVPADFARQLETELAAFKRSNERIIYDYNQRIRDLKATECDLANSERRCEAAIASWDEERERAKREGERVEKLAGELAAAKAESIEWKKLLAMSRDDRETDLISEVERLKGALALGQENCDAIYNDMREERTELTARAERAEAERDALAKDKERLDWLEATLITLCRLSTPDMSGARIAGQLRNKLRDDSGAAGPSYIRVSHPTIRAAIDAAMKGTP